MPLILATVRVVDDTVGANPVSGVAIEVYGPPGETFVTSGVTNVSGEFGFIVPAATYHLYFYKQGTTILPSQPQEIVVMTPTLLITNIFIVTSHVRAMPESIDPLRCRITGYVKGVDGRPTKDLHLLFDTVDEVIIRNNDVISPQTYARPVPDDTGYFDFELLRDVAYTGYFRMVDKLLGITPARFDVKTPNSPAANLTTLLFPIQIDVAFSATTKSLLSGNPIWDSSVDAVITWSDGSSHFTVPWATIDTVNNHPEVVEAHVQDGKLLLKPLLPGVATISARRLVTTGVNWTPIPAFTTDTIVVTVT